MKTVTQPPYLRPLSCKFGAPMGRADNIPDDYSTVKEIHLSFVPFVDGDYDAGGAYWGGGKDVKSLFCAWGESDTEQAEIYFRAAGYSDAVEQVKAAFPNARVINAGLSDFARAYVEAALWSSTDEDGNPLDDANGINDIAPDSLAVMVKEADEFARMNRADIDLACLSDSRAGHCFWLDRCGRGSGFWDEKDHHSPDSEVSACNRLSDASRECGQRDLYVGDDGKIYQS